jgi:outer membrane protein assembly factor BamD
MKDFKIAKLFYRMEDYSAAVQSFNNILKDYPDTPHREEIMFLVVKSYYRFARQSIETKQKERHSKTLSSYTEFIAQYPESKFLAEAGEMKEKSRKELETLMLRDQTDLDKERVKFQIN